MTNTSENRYGDPIACSNCGADVHPLEIFPKTRCITCHAAAPEVRRELRAMTAGRLSQMWGGRA